MKAFNLSVPAGLSNWLTTLCDRFAPKSPNVQANPAPDSLVPRVPAELPVFPTTAIANIGVISRKRVGGERWVDFHFEELSWLDANSSFVENPQFPQHACNEYILEISAELVASIKNVPTPLRKTILEANEKGLHWVLVSFE